MKNLRGLAPGVILAAVSMSAAVQAQRVAYGRTDFPTSGSPAAQEHFLEGLLALHSFEYRDAREAFLAAREIEPEFAMAAWGEAMTYNHPLWMEEDLESARAALERLAPTPEERLAKAPTAREKAYLGAVEVLFGDGDKLARDLAYADATERLMAAYPDDLDAASFHALALLGSCHDGRDTATYMRAAAIVEEVFAKNPLHPGAAHYLIHSYDDPVHAPLGLRAARAYAAIAPAAEHALHMPSHVFLALGTGEGTVASNVASYGAGEARRRRHDLGVGERGYHAMQWLFYAELQLGRLDEAQKLLDLIAADAQVTDSRRTRSYFALMRAAWAVETDRWNELPPGPDLDGLSPEAVASDLFATGFAAVRRGDLDQAGKVLAELGERYRAAAHEEDQATVSCEGYSRFGPVHLVAPRIMELELDAMIRFARGERDEALKLVEEAAAAEDTRAFGFGPPVPAKPAHELWGEMLLAAGRPDAARERFETALGRAPKRARSLQGLAAAKGSASAPAPAR
jgi:tetratricopeptide (TPR) repeat protein